MSYSIVKTKFSEVIILEPKIFSDDRGFFFESFNSRAFQEVVGQDATFVQDNHSRSVRDVLRGLHYQIKHPQGKLVRVTEGAVCDVVVDVRRYSPTFGMWGSVELSAVNRRQLWIPVGFAHGFVVTSDVAEFQYKTTDYWHPEHERILLWNDPAIGIFWPIKGKPNLSPKDAAGRVLSEAECFF